METLKLVDLFAGLGGFHRAGERLGHECVFASELDEELREGYGQNFRGQGPVHGDIRKSWDKVPPHDVLCAGFPCQPFSKSGSQVGTADETRGTLFHDVVRIAKARQPSFVILENVGNFERHDKGNTWRTVKAALEKIGYHVRGTEHRSIGGAGLLSPHHYGHPHHRERFFAIASLNELPNDPFPRPSETPKTSLAKVVTSASDLSDKDKVETGLSDQQTDCIDHWNEFLGALPAKVDPPHPIWGDEFGANYPFADQAPWAMTKSALLEALDGRIFRGDWSKAEILAALPSYARREQERFPDWKIGFIQKSREFYKANRGHLSPEWRSRLRAFPPSLRKLEWNCKGEERDLWQYVLQFRPSGLRAKRYTSCPALVSMTTTQVPILGPERRFLTRSEGLELQGFATDWALPKSRQDAFAALGNAVHVDVARRVIKAAIRPAMTLGIGARTPTVLEVLAE